MNTIKKQCSKQNELEVFELASTILHQNGLVVFPTETVYGIGGNALNSESISSIYKAKGRPSDNPLIVHLASKDQISDYAVNIQEYAYKLMDAFWPGPLTMVFNKSEKITKNITGGLDTVAIRVPDNYIAQGILRTSKLPICAPSANISGRPSSTTFKHVVEDLDGKVDMIIDGGKSVIGLESTVLDVTTETPVILRPGKITQSELESLLEIEVRSNYVMNEKQSTVPKSPGMKYKHYAPKGELMLFEPNLDEFVSSINSLELGENDFVLGATEFLENITHHNKYNLGSINDLDEISSNIFEALRYMDELKVTKMYCHLVKDEGLGIAINNRLKKAGQKY